MLNDRRTKGCPNTNCERSTKKYKYKSTDCFCTICGERLIFVCSDCFKKIEDNGAKHKYCAACEAKRKDKRDRRKDKLKKVGAAAGAVVGTAGAIVLGRRK